MIWTVCRRDLIYFFSTPLAWLVLMAWCLIINIAFYFFDVRPAHGAASYHPLFTASIQIGSLILSFLAPALTMNSFALERSQGTIQLLQTVPIKEWQLLLGKFLSCWLMLLTLVAATLIQIIILFFISDVHGPSLYAAYIGYILLSALFAAIGVWMSLLVDSPIAAYVLTFGVIILLFLFGSLAQSEGILGEIGSFIGINTRFRGFVTGDVQLGNIAYFICLSTIFLLLAFGALRARRIHG